MTIKQALKQAIEEAYEAGGGWLTEAHLAAQIRTAFQTSGKSLPPRVLLRAMELLLEQKPAAKIHEPESRLPSPYPTCSDS